MEDITTVLSVACVKEELSSQDTVNRAEGGFWGYWLEDRPFPQMHYHSWGFVAGISSQLSSQKRLKISEVTFLPFHSKIKLYIYMLLPNATDHVHLLSDFPNNYLALKCAGSHRNKLP